MNKCVIY